MSPERSSSPLQEQAVTPKMSAPASPIAGTPVRDAESSIALLLAVAQSRTNDDDLTSLSWLHERDVLKGINLVNPSPCSSINTTPVKADHFLPDFSPKSECIMDDSSISAPDSSNSSLNSPIPSQISNGTQRHKHPYHIPYDPMVHVTSKPPYSFSCLIFMAIEDSEPKALPVKEIYAWILNHFPYFRTAPTGWKNSVRHNLSLNKCFQKVEKAPNLGKGSLWTVDPQFRPNLLQALTRSPFHPCSTLDRTSHFGNHCDKMPTRLPNSLVYPCLSRTLDKKSEIRIETSEESLDAVDAAAVMLSLRNGTRFQDLRRTTQVITTSPSEDHTYSASENLSVSPDDSDDESSRYLKSGICRKIDFNDEEDRKSKEGAETLLSLAGIMTRKRNNSMNYDSKRRKFDADDGNGERPTHFRPRLLRAKKKKVTNNNNNNILQVEDEWVKHRRELEGGQNR